MRSLFSIILSGAVSLLLNSCLVSRAERPIIKGYVYDHIARTPLKGCKIGEVYTDSAGYYELEEKRYRQFTMPGMEAPPVFLIESVSMAGYRNDTISVYNPFGGGLRKGAIWRMDTVFLVKK